MESVLIQGCGDVGSAVAHVLHAAGYPVVLHDIERPPHLRRTMAFTDALFEGSAELEGTLAKLARDTEDLQPMLKCGRAVPVTFGGFQDVFRAVEPDVLVDARMFKRSYPEDRRGVKAVVVGLGPNFNAGMNVDVAVETAWGEDLGKVVAHGATKTLAGEPRELGGHGRERFVYASEIGVFSTQRSIGDRVEVGEAVGDVGGVPVLALVAGWIRGLSHDGAYVAPGAKVLEIDAGSNVRIPRGLGERPRRIAEGVLQAIRQIKAERS